MTVGERIRARRKALGLKAEDLAAAIGVDRSTIFRYENGGIEKLPISVLVPIAEALHTTPSYLMGWTDNPIDYPHDVPVSMLGRLADNIFPCISKPKRIPIYGTVAAGHPVFADEHIEGYEYADIKVPKEYFYLRVKGDSMINANIFDGDLVLVKKTSVAENGQIVVCLVNGEEATLKRFYRHGDMVILQPENPAYSPIVVPHTEFETGYARILGVAKEVKRKL